MSRPTGEQDDVTAAAGGDLEPPTDGDGVCDSADICPGFDDLLDADADGVPDG